MAKLIRDKKYKSNISKQDDPFFFDFKFMEKKGDRRKFELNRSLTGILLV